MQTKSDKKIALVGYTGFVGSNLKSAYKSKYNFNSKNIKFINNNKYLLNIRILNIIANFLFSYVFIVIYLFQVLYNIINA